VISASTDKTLRLWDLETGHLQRTFCGHFDSVDGVALTPDGRRVVSGSRDKTLKVWDLESGAVIATFCCEAGVECCACLAPNLIVAGDQGGRVYVLSLVETDN
jgi:WD40 repeat protein